MDFREVILKMTEEANKTFFRMAKATKPDKIGWKPLDEGRSVLDMAQEVAHSPTWGAGMLATREAPKFDEAMFEEYNRERSQWTTLEACEQKCNENMAQLASALRAFPVESLKETITLPFGEGMTLSFEQIAMLQHWNTTYHTGQVAYVQTLYGDKNMH
ncbi:MAG: hypothetical protein HUU60_00065 [Armatimonadetes bacterium]|nr:hypothetical protein [Armatimonadota bacterium]